MIKKKIFEIFICFIFILSTVNIGSCYDTGLDNPIVTITDPDDGTIFDNPNIELIGNAMGIGIKRIDYVILYAGGGIYGSSFDINPPVEYYEFSIDFEIVEGSDGNIITITAIDIDDNEGSDYITVFYEPGGEENNPPYPPEDPIPADDANLVNVNNVLLKWFCLDVDVYDDVYFTLFFESDDSTPDVNISWQNKSSYLIDELEPCTHYYWKVVANDGNGGVSESPVWDFTTKDNIPPTGYFVSPKQYHVYFRGKDFGPLGRLFGKTIVFDWVEVEVYAEDNIGIDSVTFFIDDEPVAILWEPPYVFNLFQGGSHEIKAQILDKYGFPLNLTYYNSAITVIPTIDVFDDCEESFVMLWPTRNQWGKNGNLVPGITDPDPEYFPRHYVSPVNGLQDWDEGGDNVIVEAAVQWGDCKPIPTFRWKPPVPDEVTIIGYFAYVPRDNPGKYVLTGQLMRGDSVVSESTLTVWIVESVIERNLDYPYFTVEKIPLSTGVKLRGNIGFKHSIEPASIFTDPDRPNLIGNNTISPPNVSSYATDVFNNGTDLSGGANRYWDNSRQIRIKTVFTDIPEWIKLYVYDEDYITKWSNYTTWPSSLFGIVGNDDESAKEEINEPYSNIGVLTGTDRPARYLPYMRNGYYPTAKVEIRFHFREFTRLQIGDKWFRISEYFPWKCHLKFKTDIDGITWIDDNSIIELNNDGFW